MRERFCSVLIALLVAMCGAMGGCSASTPAANAGVGTIGGRQIDDSPHADDNRFDPNAFMGGFEGSPTP